MNENNKRIFLSPPHLSGNELAYVTGAIKSNWIAPAGPDLAAFEADIAKTAGMKFAAAVSSCTAAIHLCLMALNVKKGDTVFCSDLTFAGSCNPIMYLNAEPVFIDSEQETSNMSPEALQRALDWAKKEGKLPKAVIAVDLYGQPCKFDEILSICSQYNVPLIEDAAEALGAQYKGRPCGSLGVMGVYSFNGNKIITTSGGGMIVSNDEEAVKRMKYLSTQAKLPYYYYEHTEIGYNYRMSNICAALGRAQLEGLPSKVTRRHEIYDTYKKGFCNIPVRMLPVYPEGEPNYWLSVILLNDDSKIEPLTVITALEKNSIESRPVWKPMHMQPVYKDKVFFKNSSTSVSEELFAKGVCLPSGSSLTPEEQNRVIDIVKSCF